MRIATINTILNNAPMIIQGATRLIKMIKQRNEDSPEENKPEQATIESLSIEIEKLNHKLEDNSAADVEQIELIEQLARQNEALAESIKQVHKSHMIIAIVSCIALLCSLAAIILYLG